MKIDFSLPVNPMEMPAAARHAGYGELDWASLGEGLKAAMKSLPIGLRFIFHLWAVEESSINEIAELLGVPSVEIWVRLTEARAALCRFASEAPEDPHSM
jgi:DNA-directed RNA polymerase specialized sigma24 family protein